MFFGRLAFIFEVMVYLGLGLPLVNLLMGLLAGLGGSSADAGGELSAEADLDMDMDFDMEVDADFDLDTAPEVGEVELETGGSAPNGARGFPVRFNLYCLCLALVITGAIGVFALETLRGPAQLLTLAGGVVLAALAYTLVYRLVVLPLKKNNADALSMKSLRFRHAVVTFRILKDSPGKIQTRDAVGAVISYPAELDPDLCELSRIDEGQEVIITDLDRENNLCYVTLAQRKILNTEGKDASITF